MFPSRPQARTAARTLGWLSIAIGVAHVLAPGRMARAAGVSDRTRMMRGIGLREVATGVALLNSRQPAAWLWARVAGDLLDVALLARACSDRSGATRATLVAVSALAVADLALAHRLGQAAPRARIDYTRRSGFPLPTDQMRGLARSDFEPPLDLRVPSALRPWSPLARDSARGSDSIG